MATEQNARLTPISSVDVPWEEWFQVPRFGVRYRHLSRAALGDSYRVGVAIEELLPGKQASPAHYHIFEEEHLYILEGALTMRVGETTHEMKAGDYVCFPASQKAGHCMINHTDATCRYVIVGENNPNEITIYTDSNKVLIRALGRRALFDLSAKRTYWDGENTGLPDGVSPPPDDEGPGVAHARPQPPISSDRIEWDDESGAGTLFGGRSKHLTHAAVGASYHVALVIESPGPGKRLAPNHYHMLEEEHALILEGEVTLFLGDDRFVMKPGDYVCFPAGRKVGHSFMNSGAGPCRYLMIGERNTDDVCVYPDSNKVGVYALRAKPTIFDMSGAREYWDGEKIT